MLTRKLSTIVLVMTLILSSFAYTGISFAVGGNNKELSSSNNVITRVNGLTKENYEAAFKNNEITVTLTEGTNISVTVSPNRNNIIMDLQGVLWSVPMDGGTGKRLTDNFVDPSYPDFSPNGDKVAFQSYQGGNYHVWTMKPDGSDMRQHTFGTYDDREPSYSPDGTKIAFASDRSGSSYDIWVVDLVTGNLTQWTDSPENESHPTWSPNGSEIAFVNGKSVEAINQSGVRRTLATVNSGTIAAPSWSPDGNSIAYISEGNLFISGNKITEGEDVFPFSVDWISDNQIVYTADGHIKSRNLKHKETQNIPFSVHLNFEKPNYKFKKHDFNSNGWNDVKGIIAPKISPDGKQIALVALNDLWLWEIGNNEPRPLTNDPYMELDPTWSPDGKRLAYSSDKSGTEDIYIIDLETGKEERLTSSNGAEVSSAWSRDGKQIAYQDQNGGLYTVDIDTKEVKQVVSRMNLPGPPTWGPNNTIALASLNQITPRYREGTNQILIINPETGSQKYVDPIPFKSLSNRKDSGPVWSPDGKHIAFIIESQLWVMPVDESGNPTSKPYKISEDIADSPDWSSDSTSLLYLSNGDLKVVSINGGEPKKLPFNMKWKPQQPTGKKVIHAGKIWDGISKNVQEDVDIFIAGNRIVEIKPHKDSNHKGGDFIDASNLTVIPGLWDAHIHQNLNSEFFGSRQGLQLLSFGITSTVSMGDYVYRAIEDKEAINSGARLSPRYFAASELIEGSRVYYSSMRPTTSLEAVQRELERASAFDVDLIKTYVRFPNDHQAAVIEAAHKLGVPAFSHYFFPSMAFGQDGTSHISATQRAFSRTVSSNGIAYEDVIQLAGKSGMSVTSSLFGSNSMMAYYPGLDKDPRTKVLYTPFQYNSFKSAYDRSFPGYSQEIAEDVTILKNIIDAGGIVVAGTDSPLTHIAFSLHSELAAMEKYGMSNYEALRTATYYPALKLGVADDLGTIEKGKLADLVFVEGNPLEDITDTANVKLVMKNGKAYTIDEIIAPYADK